MAQVGFAYVLQVAFHSGACLVLATIIVLACSFLTASQFSSRKASWGPRSVFLEGHVEAPSCAAEALAFVRTVERLSQFAVPMSCQLERLLDRRE